MGKSSVGRNLALDLCLLAAAQFLPVTSARAQAKSSEPRTAKIVVRILNGKTGWPIWAELPNIWIGAAHSPIDPPPRTNWRGEITVEVPASGPREIRFLPNWYIDCRPSSDHMAGRKMEYSVDDILERGIVTENVCGKTRAKPVPGVLTLYVRPRTWEEIMEL
ncbi:MAG: hypothetical protein WA639_00735 [Candidatus Acidiferrum sp.]